ncbi:MAG: undecaprenyl-diphosphate phosphatase [Firmicutes bacterium]|nr:undecaprenyl-diphosphate phosphatase [Bacillota bacterium]
MTIFQAFILGLLQGLGEFLPISSSAHLYLVPWLFGWPYHGLVFDVALHLGTLVAVIAFFWRDWLTLIRHGLKQGGATREGKLFWFIVIASIPGAIAGYFLEEAAETFFRQPALNAVMLMAMGGVLYLADRYGRKQQGLETIHLGQSLIIGLSQALSIIPGVSRSGVTISSGLLTGLTREGAARFSFLLSTPIVAGAGFLKLFDLKPEDLSLPFFIGIGTSAVVGFLVIGLLLRWLKKSSFLPFVWYRLLLGLVIILTVILR